MRDGVFALPPPTANAPLLQPAWAVCGHRRREVLLAAPHASPVSPTPPRLQHRAKEISRNTELGDSIPSCSLRTALDTADRTIRSGERLQKAEIALITHTTAGSSLLWARSVTSMPRARWNSGGEECPHRDGTAGLWEQHPTPCKCPQRSLLSGRAGDKGTHNTSSLGAHSQVRLWGQGPL